MINKKAFAKHLCALLLFGTNGIVASHIALNSVEIVFFRSLIGSLLLLFLFKVSGNRFHILRENRDALFIVLSGMAMGASWMFLFEAYRHIGVGMSTLLYYCGPVIVMILSPLLFHETLTIPKMLGFLAVLIGVILINGKSSASGLNAQGLFCGFMAACLYALMFIFNKQSSHITGMENAVIQLCASFLTVAVFVGLRQHFVIPITRSDWLPVMLLGALNTGIGCYLYFSPLKQLPVQTVAICGYLEPLGAVVFSALLLGEQMNRMQTLGAILILGGAMFAEIAGDLRSAMRSHHAK